MGPRGTLLYDGVDHDQELAHGCNERNFLGLSFVQQPKVKGFERWVEPHRRERSHIQDGAHGGPSAPNVALAPEGAALTVKRSHPHQSGDLLSVELAQLRQ